MFSKFDANTGAVIRYHRAVILACCVLCVLFAVSPDPEAGAVASAASAGPPPLKASPGNRSSKLIQVNKYRFDPLLGVPDLPPGLRYAQLPEEERTAHIIQFNAPITGSMRLELEALGVRVLGYIPEDAYLVEADARQIERARKLASVRWAGLLEPAFKLSPDLAVEFDHVINRTIEELRREGGGPGGNAPSIVDTSQVVPVVLRVLGPGSEEEIARFLRTHGGTDLVVPRQGGESMSGKVPRGLLHRLAHQPGLIWIERESPVFLANDRAAWTVQSNNPVTRERTVHERGLSGLGQTITIADSGIDWDHDAFVEVLGDGTHIPPGASHRKVSAYYVPGDSGGDCHENPAPEDPNAPPDTPAPIQHGTHVAGTAAGDDAFWAMFDGNGIRDPDSIEIGTPHDGVVFLAKLQVQDISGFSFAIGPPNDLHELFRPAVDPNARVRDPDEPACPPVVPPAPASFIHSNSWGAFTDPSYTSKTREIDDFLWSPSYNPSDPNDHGNHDLLVLFAAGNRGFLDGAYSIGPHAAAKNSLTVGASGNAEESNNFATDPATDTRHFSSRGPTCDGRIKPDVMAPGRSLWSAMGCDTPRFGTCEITGRDCDRPENCRETCGPDGCEISGQPCDASNPCPLEACIPRHTPCHGYRRLTGTSMATPVVAGAAALVREYYTSGFYPGGAPDSDDVRVPSAALIKATLINGAVEMTGAGAYENGEAFYPNNQQGWGRIHLDESLYFQGESQVLQVHDERTGVMQGQTMSYSFNVTPTCGPLEATLVWTDAPPALPIACDPDDITQVTAPTLVNDLDLVVRSPQGTKYRGNVFSGTANPGFSVANPHANQADRRNNVEGVLVLPVVTPGTWTVEVKGHKIPPIDPNDPNAQRQPFALVINCADADDDDDGDLDWNDCAPLDPAIGHGLEEICNGIDDNCSGGIDEGFADTDGDGHADCLDLVELPNSDAGPNEGSPFPAGPHYLNVDDLPHDGDTSYIGFAVSGLRTAFGIADQLSDSAIITKVRVRWVAKEGASGTEWQGQAGLVIGTQESYGPPRYLGAAYTQFEETFLNNPATGQAWTVQDVRNAKLIYQHVAGENILPRAKLTQMVLVVTVERLP